MKQKKMDKIVKYETIINVILMISFMCISRVLTVGDYENYIYIFMSNTIVSGLLSGFLLFKYHLVSKVYNKTEVIGKRIDYILALALGALSSKIIINSFYSNADFLKTSAKNIGAIFNISFEVLWKFICLFLFISSVIGIMFIFLGLIKYVLPKIILFFKKLNKTEKKYLIYASIIFCVVALIIQLQTTAFTVPVERYNIAVVNYDVIYTTDAGVQIKTKGFNNINATENDIRQPLFGLFSFPFGLVANTMSEIFDFFSDAFVYSYVIVCFQGFLLNICAILLMRMIKKETDIFGLLFFSVMYATMFFGLNIEQYVFGVFWLIVFFYNYVKNKKSNIILCAASIGSLITNAVVIPFVARKDTFKKYVLDSINHMLFFACLIFCFGQTYNVINGYNTFDKYKDFMGKEILFKDKILQYLDFISNCFIAPKGKITILGQVHAAYKLIPVEAISILGILLLLGMVLSFILNHKKKIVKISFGWLLLSILLLVIIGWGTTEGELIIFGIYFSWAFFILIYSLIDYFMQKLPKKIRIITWITIILLLFTFNVLELIRIINFGRLYYPLKQIFYFNFL